jgi:L-aspartate oxidase
MTRIANRKKGIHDYYWNFSVEPRLLELRNLARLPLLEPQKILSR